MVRRKRPRPQQQQQPQQPFSADQPPRRVPARVNLDSGIRAQQDQQPRQPPVRTRVRRPQLPGFTQEPEPTTPRGPPQFSLSSDEAIQRFRDQNRFAPQAGGSRLTVLSGRAPAEEAAQPQPRPTPFTAFRNRVRPENPEVDESGFGNR